MYLIGRKFKNPIKPQEKPIKPKKPTRVGFLKKRGFANPDYYLGFHWAFFAGFLG
jgi:hypothetical protein